MANYSANRTSTDEAKMNRELHRISSYDNIKNISRFGPLSLAKNGLFCCDQGRIIRCYACHFECRCDGLIKCNYVSLHRENVPECCHLVELRKANSSSNSYHKATNSIDKAKMNQEHPRVSTYSSIENISHSGSLSLAKNGLFYDCHGRIIRCYACHFEHRCGRLIDCDYVTLHEEEIPACRHLVELHKMNASNNGDLNATGESVTQNTVTLVHDDVPLSRQVSQNQSLEYMKTFLRVAKERAKSKGVFIAKCPVVLTQKQLEELQELQEENERLKDEWNCVACKINRKDLVLLPCRHYGICRPCYPRIQNASNWCPCCRKAIAATIAVVHNN